MPVLNWRSRSSNLGRFGSLLAALTLTFTVAPFMSDEAEGVTEISILYTVVMLVGAYAVSKSRRIFWIGIALAVPAVSLEWISNFVVNTPLVLANMIAASAFILYVGGVVFYEVLDESEVTYDTIAGGISVFLLIGVGWVLPYAGLEYMQPGSFLIMGQTLQQVHPEIQVRYSEFLYFSFVTMTTLGYGDMVGTTPPARAMASAEAIVGQIYITVFVARLVGLHLAGQQRQDFADERTVLRRSGDERTVLRRSGDERTVLRRSGEERAVLRRSDD